MKPVAVLALTTTALGPSLASAVAVTPGTTPTATLAAPTTAPSQCAITTTHTWYGNASMGCQYPPATEFCVVDDVLILPCGCTSATNVVQQTTTVCATKQSAINCYTGYMFTTTATNC